MARPRVADGGDGLQIWRVAVNILNKQLTMGDPQALGLGEGLTDPHREKPDCCETLHRSSALDTSLKPSRQRKMDTKFRTWNVNSVCRTGSLKSVTSELTKYNLDLAAVEEVGWDKDYSEPAGDFIFFYGNENANHHLGTGFFVHKEIILAVKREDFINDRISYIKLKNSVM